MKNYFIRMIATSLSVFCMIGAVSITHATDTALTPSILPEGYLAQFLSPFYENDFSSYIMNDTNGNNVRTAFMNATYSLYIDEDWDAIKDVYKSMNLTGIHRRQEVDAPSTRASDLAKTVTDGYYEILQCTSHNVDRDIEVGTELRGTFYYNPNTYAISQVSKPILTYVAISYTGPNRTHSTPVLSGSKSGSYNARFSCSFSVTDPVTTNGVTVTFRYGPYRHSFTASSN